MPLRDILSLQSVIWLACVVAIAGGAFVILVALIALLRKRVSVVRAAVIIICCGFSVGVGAYVLPRSHEMFRTH